MYAYVRRGEGSGRKDREGESVCVDARGFKADLAD